MPDNNKRLNLLITMSSVYTIGLKTQLFNKLIKRLFSFI